MRSLAALKAESERKKKSIRKYQQAVKYLKRKCAELEKANATLIKAINE